jgi:hypothetical protein
MCQLRGESALFLFPLFVKFITRVFRPGLCITSEKWGKVKSGRPVLAAALWEGGQRTPTVTKAQS